jgi:hypothetical protein
VAEHPLTVNVVLNAVSVSMLQWAFDPADETQSVRRCPNTVTVDPACLTIASTRVPTAV